MYSTNVNLTAKNVVQIKFAITINADVSAKIEEKICLKKVIFGIPLHVVLKMVDTQKEFLVIQ